MGVTQAFGCLPVSRLIALPPRSIRSRRACTVKRSPTQLQVCVSIVCINGLTGACNAAKAYESDNSSSFRPLLWLTPPLVCTCTTTAPAVPWPTLLLVRTTTVSAVFWRNEASWPDSYCAPWILRVCAGAATTAAASQRLQSKKRRGSRCSNKEPRRCGWAHSFGCCMACPCVLTSNSFTALGGMRVRPLADVDCVTPAFLRSTLRFFALHRNQCILFGGFSCS